MITALKDNNVKIISYIRYKLPREDISNASKSNGFIYLQPTNDNKIDL